MYLIKGERISSWIFYYRSKIALAAGGAMTGGRFDSNWCRSGCDRWAKSMGLDI